MRARDVNNSQDIIDSRDVIARIEELEGEFDNLISDIVEAREAEEGEDYAEDLHDAFVALAAWLEVDVQKIENEALNFECLSAFMETGEAYELKVLKALADEGEGSPDWHYGETLIRDSYFTEYARELASDLYGKEIDDAKWPFDHIGWDSAADALKQDYMSIDFDGETYWIRA